MNDIIKIKYAEKAIVYDNIWMYFINTAKEVVCDCEKNNLKITSLDAFKLSGEGIQPSQAHSIDFGIYENSWKKSKEFLSNITDTTYLYEIWYEGY